MAGIVQCLLCVAHIRVQSRRCSTLLPIRDGMIIFLCCANSVAYVGLSNRVASVGYMLSIMSTLRDETAARRLGHSTRGETQT